MLDVQTQAGNQTTLYPLASVELSPRPQASLLLEVEILLAMERGTGPGLTVYTDCNLRAKLRRLPGYEPVHQRSKFSSTSGRSKGCCLVIPLTESACQVCQPLFWPEASFSAGQFFSLSKSGCWSTSSTPPPCLPTLLWLFCFETSSCYIALAGLEFVVSPSASASQVLRRQACATKPAVQTARYVYFVLYSDFEHPGQAGRAHLLLELKTPR